MAANQHTTEYTYERVLARLRGLRHELGRPPTTRDADGDDSLPALDTIYRIADAGWNEILEDAGIEPTQVEAYTGSDRDAMVADIRRVFSMREAEQLPSRVYSSEGNYTTSTIKDHFGSWSEACAEANVPSGSKHGERCTGPRCEELDSRHEQRIAFLLCSFGVEYDVHESVPNTE